MAELAHVRRPAATYAAQTGRTHDRTRRMLQQRQKVLAKAPSTHDPNRISSLDGRPQYQTVNSVHNAG